MLGVTDFSGPKARRWVLLGLLLATAVVRADTPSEWLAKVPLLPKNLDEAQALCGRGVDKSYDPAKDPWGKFDQQIRAAIDKQDQDTKDKLNPSNPQAQQDMAAQMMAQMGDPNAMMANLQSAQTYSQYTVSLGKNAPKVSADTYFRPALTGGQNTVNSVLKMRNAKLDKCPQEQGEGGDFPAPSCANPIQQDAEQKKADAANAYLAAVNQAWPRYLAGVKDYLAKVAALPPGVDANNPQIKLQLAAVPGTQLSGVKDTAEVTQQLCTSALGLKTQSNPNGG